MRVTVRATEDAIIRLLKAGHPIPDHIAGRRWGEIRLPVFTRVEAVPVKNYNIPGPGRSVVARGRRDFWFVDIKRRSGKIGVEDCENFLKMHSAIEDHLRKNSSATIVTSTEEEPGMGAGSLKVTGWLVATSGLTEEAEAVIRNSEVDIDKLIANGKVKPEDANACLKFCVTSGAARR